MFKLKKQVEWLMRQLSCLKQEIEDIIENGVPSLLTSANTDDVQAADGTTVVNPNTDTIAAYQEHLIFQEGEGVNSNVSVLRLSDDFLNSLNTEDKGQIIPIEVNGTTSYALRGVDRSANHVALGENTMDLIRHFSMNQVGIGGDNGFGYGYDLYSAPSSFGSTLFGFNNRINGGQLITVLGQNITANSGYADLIIGESNTLNSPLGYTFTSGRNNKQEGRYAGIIGVGLTNRGAGTIVGTSNVERPGTTFFDSTNPLFIVGNGTLSNNALNTPLMRSDAFEVLQNGKVAAPSLTPALINSDAKSLITREYLEQNSQASTALQPSNLLQSLSSTSTTDGVSANKIKELADQVVLLQDILFSDDATLDELQEVVDYIKQNKEDLNDLGISNIAGLVDALNGKATAAQGVLADNALPKSGGVVSGRLTLGDRLWSSENNKQILNQNADDSLFIGNPDAIVAIQGSSFKYQNSIGQLRNIYHEGNLNPNSFATTAQGIKADNSVQKTGDETINGTKTFNDTLKVGKRSGLIAVFGDSNFDTKYVQIRDGNNTAVRWGLQATTNIATLGASLMASDKPIAFKAGVPSAVNFEDVIDPHMLIEVGTGNIGIGEVNPTEKLEVNGNVKADNFIGNGSQLTLESPNGTLYSLVVDDAGNLSTTVV